MLASDIFPSDTIDQVCKLFEASRDLWTGIKEPRRNPNNISHELDSAILDVFK